MVIKAIYIALGSLSLLLGLLGIITPGLPTTPFLLLTAFFYARSSPKLYKKLLDHKITGKYIKKVNNGVSVKTMIISISLMWCMICFSAFVFFKTQTMQLIMLGLGVVGTVAQIIVLRKRKNAQSVEKIEKTSKEERKEPNEKTIIDVNTL